MALYFFFLTFVSEKLRSMKSTVNEKIAVVPFSVFGDLVLDGGGSGHVKTLVRDSYAVGLGMSRFLRSSFKDAGHVRVDCMRWGVVTAGATELVVDGVPYHCQKGDLMYINWGAVMSPYVLDTVSVYNGLAMREDYLYSIFHGHVPLLFSDPSRCFCIHLQNDEREMINRYLYMLVRVVEAADSDGATAPFMASLMKFVEQCYNRHAGQRDSLPARDGNGLMRRFLTLVEDNVQHEHQLAFYASELCTTPSYLGTQVVQLTGQTPKEWIDRVLLLRSKVALRCGTQPVKQLASDLGFVSSSAFCKFFKRLEGMSPQAFRDGGDRLE